MNAERHEVLEVLAVLSDAYPDLRLGQLMVTAGNWATRQPDSLWDVTDEELLNAIISHLERTGVATVAQGSSQ